MVLERRSRSMLSDIRARSHLPASRSHALALPRALLRLKLKHLQPIVPRVDRDDAVALVHRDAPTGTRAGRVAAAGAPDLQALAGLLVDQLHAVVAELADDQVAVAGPRPGRRGSGTARGPSRRAPMLRTNVPSVLKTAMR